MVLTNLRRGRGRKTRSGRLQSDGPTTNIMRFDVVRKERDDSRVPTVLRPVEEQLDPTHLPTDISQVSKTRKVVFERNGGFWTMNRKIWDEDRIDERPREGDTEIWEFVNKGGGWVHPVRIYLLNFKILDRDGKPPFIHERGWKETVLLGTNDTVRVSSNGQRCPWDPNRAISPAGILFTAT